MTAEVAVEVAICDTVIEPGVRAAQRPRAQPGGGRSYNPPEYRRELERVGWLLAAARKGGRPVNGDVRLDCRFYRETNGRVDIDNLLKTIMDAGTGVLWVDDAQIVSVHARKYRGVGRGRSRTVVRVTVAKKGAFDV